MYSIVLLMAMSGTPDVAMNHRGCGGCHGGCHSCHGGCHCCGGCYGCCGGCCGGCYGGCCGGCYGGCYGGYSSCHGGCYGGYATSCYGGYGGYAVAYGSPAMPSAPAAPATTAPTPMVTGPAPAAILVTLPADAKLTIDTTATTATTGYRLFTTPDLPRDQTFAYTLTAEITRDGKTFATVQKISVKAGATTRVELPAATFRADAVARK